jgi:hypothetical protein
VPSARARLLDKLNRFDVRLIVSDYLNQHRDPTFGGQRHLCVPAVAFVAAQMRSGDGRCAVTVRFLTKQCRGHNRTVTWAARARLGRDQRSRPLSVLARSAAFSSAPSWLTWTRAQS